MVKRIFGWAFVVVVAFSLSGCGLARKRHPLLDTTTAIQPVMGLRDVRDWGDRLSPVLQHSLAQGDRDYRAWRKARHLPPETDISILALSGGGADGAFGAGVLYGWAAKGTRPEFRVVTGVSTGALSAPFVFLGEKYDPVLQKLYTTTKTKDIFLLKNILHILFGDSVADTSPLRQLVRDYVTPEMLTELAREHARGRRLFISTTNLDAQRNVVWDIGAIAASGHPKALNLIREVMVASASIPVAFPPVYIPVEKDGKVYDEMHVDGGVISQFIVYDAYLLPKEIEEDAKAYETYKAIRKNVYVIINNKLGPVGEAVSPHLYPIATRSIATLIKSQAKGSLAYSYLLTKRDDFSLHYIVIPESFDSLSAEPFDPVAMRKTFNLGFSLGKEGASWESLPPGYTE